MPSKPHRKSCEEIVTGLSRVRAYALAYPRSLKTARFNTSHRRAKPQIQEKIARLRAQPDAIAGPAMLNLIEKRLWLARFVRANPALRNPKIDGEMLVNLPIDSELKTPRMNKIRIPGKIIAIKLDTPLAGDEPSTSTPMMNLPPCSGAQPSSAARLSPLVPKLRLETPLRAKLRFAVARMTTPSRFSQRPSVLPLVPKLRFTHESRQSWRLGKA